MSMINADENFEKLGLTLPPAPAPAGVYKPCVIDGKYCIFPVTGLCGMISP